MSNKFWALYRKAVTPLMDQEERYWLVQRIRWEQMLELYDVEWDPTIRF